MRFVLLILCAAVLSDTPLSCADDPPLQMLALFGAQLAEVDAEMREKWSLGDGGVLIEKMIRDSSAARDEAAQSPRVLANRGKLPRFIWRVEGNGDSIQPGYFGIVTDMVPFDNIS